MAGDIFSLAKKMERAARNDTGFMVTADEMRLLLGAGVYEAISALKIRELQSRCGVLPIAARAASAEQCEPPPRN